MQVKLEGAVAGGGHDRRPRVLEHRVDGALHLHA